MRNEPVARRFNETKDRDPSDIGRLIPNQPRKNGPSIKRIGGLAPGLQSCGHLLQLFLSSPALGER